MLEPVGGGWVVRIEEIQVVIFGELSLKWEGFKKGSSHVGFDFLEQVVDFVFDPLIKFLGRKTQLMMCEEVRVQRGGVGSGSVVFLHVSIKRSSFWWIGQCEGHPGRGGGATWPCSLRSRGRLPWLVRSW